jgi:phosphoglycerate dehydrogenase-like enzyme
MSDSARRRENPGVQTLWVLARPGDEGLRYLDRVPAGIRVSVGLCAEDFAGPPPDVLLTCWVGHEIVEPVFHRAMPGLRWIHSRSAGVDRMLFPALVESAVVVTNGRGVFGPGLGEYVAAAVLFFAKGLGRMRRSQAERRWDPFFVEWVRGRTLGIVGYGDIGRAVAERMRGFGMRILGLRRHPELAAGDPHADEVLGPDRLLDLMGRSDYVVVSTPLTPRTRGLIGEREIAAMRPTGVLINVGRGAVVDEDALVRALRDGRIRGAALDVFETEPLPAEHPFWGMENVLLSPHCGDQTQGWVEEAMQAFFDNLARFQRGGPLAGIVDKQRGY